MALIVSWNVNSIKSRLEHIQKFVNIHNPDIILLQEIKCESAKFPYLEIEDLGYNIALKGQKSYNGVAILSKSPIEDIFSDLVPESDNKDEARYIEGFTKVGDLGVRVASVYVPHGNEVGSEKFKFKIRYYEYLSKRFHELLKTEKLFIAGGDYNVAPEPIDVYNPKHLEGTLGFHIDERKGFRAILFSTGMKDSFRISNPNAHEYSWWDYRSGGWQHNKGMRIDQILTSPSATDRLHSAGIISEVRGWDKASDHAPIFCKI